jgi:TrmH family RNA methyltransferase
MHLTKNELKFLRSLAQKKVRKAEKKFIIEGWRAVRSVLQSPSKIELVAMVQRYLDDPDYRVLLAQLEERGCIVRELTEPELSLVADTVHAQGVVAVVAQRASALDAHLLARGSLVVLADSLQDPGNLGSVIRSSDWFNADALILGEGCVDLYNEKVVRSTVGSIVHLPILEHADLRQEIDRLKRAEFTVIALSGDGKDIYTDIPSGKTAVILGSEAHGVSRELRTLADAVVRIPRYGRAESLNVGVACGIVLAHLRTQHERKKGAVPA